MATKVFVQKDGIVNHQHEGISGWHNPFTKHRGELHASEDAAHPTNADEVLVSDALKEQYEKALAGEENFYSIYRVNVATRRANGTIQCDARCRSAHPGSPCDCNCGGANHGADYVEAPVDVQEDQEQVSPEEAEVPTSELNSEAAVEEADAVVAGGRRGRRSQELF